MKKSVVITGVSTGIGFAAAEVLINRGYHVFGSVRKEADGQRVKEELGAEFTPLLFDVTDTEALPAAVAVVQAAVGENGLAGLVNNAGVRRLDRCCTRRWRRFARPSRLMFLACWR